MAIEERFRKFEEFLTEGEISLEDKINHGRDLKDYLASLEKQDRKELANGAKDYLDI
jgi:hypothetical protein